ncbi:C-X-C motif chemokine 17 isoform X2 [Phascolarctos cinereus]|uniref:C-X-C motif chemokine 17 isoform X2 n=1 Tax=Phascolarctos cinereus TaxID=38626 RepID=A0A6P5LSH7_PHACI|nr:C-X-C motif chemokine 17 isoform X2 [Phascolarctos cinereus]
MRAPVFSLLLLLLPLSVASSSSNPEGAEGQRDHKLSAKRHSRGSRQACQCEDVFQNIHGGKTVLEAKPPARQCPCDRLKPKQKNAGLWTSHLTVLSLSFSSVK